MKSLFITVAAVILIGSASYGADSAESWSKPIDISDASFTVYPAQAVHEVSDPELGHYWIVYLSPAHVTSIMELKWYVNKLYFDYCENNVLHLPKSFEQERYPIVFRFDIACNAHYGSDQLPPFLDMVQLIAEDTDRTVVPFTSGSYPYTLDFHYGAKAMVNWAVRIMGAKPVGETDKDPRGNMFIEYYPRKASSRMLSAMSSYVMYLKYIIQVEKLKCDSIEDGELEASQTDDYIEYYIDWQFCAD